MFTKVCFSTRHWNDCGVHHTHWPQMKGGGRGDSDRETNGSHIFSPHAFVFRALDKSEEWFTSRETGSSAVCPRLPVHATRQRKYNNNNNAIQADKTVLLTQTLVPAAVLLLSNKEGRWEGGEGGWEWKGRRIKKEKSLLDPEIIAHATTDQECGSSGGQIVVFSLS